MTEHNIGVEVLDGLREIREHREGKRTLRTVHVDSSSPWQNRLLSQAARAKETMISNWRS